jgi:hypothetical protein
MDSASLQRLFCLAPTWLQKMQSPCLDCAIAQRGTGSHLNAFLKSLWHRSTQVHTAIAAYQLHKRRDAIANALKAP